MRMGTSTDPISTPVCLMEPVEPVAAEVSETVTMSTSLSALVDRQSRRLVTAIQHGSLRY